MSKQRKYLPTLAELIDRLSISQLKEVFIVEHKNEYSKEISDIVNDIQICLEESTVPLTADTIRAIIVLSQMNLHIWHNESNVRKGKEGPNALALTHGLNGIRNTAKNIIQEVVGGRKDYKIDCLAADFKDWEISWKTGIQIEDNKLSEEVKSTAVNLEEVMEGIDLLKPKNVNLKKVRIGPKVVISLSTIPSRLSDTKYGDQGIKSCIESLQNQTYDNYEVHFNIPYKNNYSGEEYIIPDWLSQFDKIQIKRVEDIGPATKAVPTIERITDLDTIIIICDDDLVYHPEMVSEHVKNQLTRDCAFGYDSLGTYEPKFNDIRDHYVVSVPFEMIGRTMQHYKTVSYKRRYFDNDFFTDFVGKTKSDDVLLSAYMQKQGITKMVMPYDGEAKLETLEQWQASGGVTTFPVLRHTHHDSGDGCRDPRAVEIEPPFFMPQEFTDKQYV